VQSECIGLLANGDVAKLLLAEFLSEERLQCDVLELQKLWQLLPQVLQGDQPLQLQAGLRARPRLPYQWAQSQRKDRSLWALLRRDCIMSPGKHISQLN